MLEILICSDDRRESRSVIIKFQRNLNNTRTHLKPGGQAVGTIEFKAPKGLEEILIDGK